MILQHPGRCDIFTFMWAISVFVNVPEKKDNLSILLWTGQKWALQTDIKKTAADEAKSFFFFLLPIQLLISESVAFLLIWVVNLTWRRALKWPVDSCLVLHKPQKAYKNTQTHIDNKWHNSHRHTHEVEQQWTAFSLPCQREVRPHKNTHTHTHTHKYINTGIPRGVNPSCLVTEHNPESWKSAARCTAWQLDPRLQPNALSS